MSTLTQLIKAATLPITPRHERWLALPESERDWSPAALELADKVFRREAGGKRMRSTRYRASDSGKCLRYRQFRAEGLPGVNSYDTRMSNIFITGDFYHLKWQMIGLTEGWLADAEVPYEDPRTVGMFGGTADGILFDGSLFELKSINSRGFSRVTTYGPVNAHVLQVSAYMYLADVDCASIVYEEKNSGDWREFRVFRDAEITAKVEAELELLITSYKEELLPPILDDCEMQTGTTYRQCQFRDACSEIKGWSDIADSKAN